MREVHKVFLFILLEEAFSKGAETSSQSISASNTISFISLMNAWLQPKTKYNNLNSCGDTANLHMFTHCSVLQYCPYPRLTGHQNLWLAICSSLRIPSCPCPINTCILKCDFSALKPEMKTFNALHFASWPYKTGSVLILTRVYLNSRILLDFGHVAASAVEFPPVCSHSWSAYSI